MAVFRPFCALRPTPEYAAAVAALPYDVMNSAEARRAVQGKPFSFLHVDKAEIDLAPEIDPYDKAVYQKARENLDALEQNGICAQDSAPCFYIYRQIMDGRSIYRQNSGGSELPVSAEDESYCLSVAAPIITEGDVMGCVLFVTARGSVPGTEVELKLAQTAALFLGKQMES